ncbi:MAG: protein phosphatase 2C domain-containing protein [Gemmatimonadaceae bacterium]
MPTPLRGSPADVTVEVFALSDVGLTRDHNEDAFVVADLSEGTPVEFAHQLRQAVPDKGVLFMVADGMGGAAAGELASATAVDVVLQYLREQWMPRPDAPPDDFVEILEQATDVANGAIFRYASEHPELRGMGTTATIAGLLGDTLYLAQVGDSRAYLVRGGVARQITKDQSLMQKLIEAGEISEEDAERNERRNIILQALGPEAAIKIDLTHQRVRHGDVLLLCSDGLSGLVRADEFGKAVSEEPDLPAVCRRLITLANSLGGPDNITVVAARFEGPGLSPPHGHDHVGHQVYDVPGRSQSDADSMEEMMQARTLQMEALHDSRDLPLPTPERQEKVLVAKGVLAASAVVLGGYMLWRLLQIF